MVSQLLFITNKRTKQTDDTLSKTSVIVVNKVMEPYQEVSWFITLKMSKINLVGAPVSISEDTLINWELIYSDCYPLVVSVLNTKSLTFVTITLHYFANCT